MADLAFFFKGKGGLISMAALELIIVAKILGMNQVKVKITDAAPFKLFFKKRPYILFLIKIRGRELIGKKVGFPRVAARQGLAER